MTIFGKLLPGRGVKSDKSALGSAEKRVEKVERGLNLLETQIELFRVEREEYERARRNRQHRMD